MREQETQLKAQSQEEKVKQVVPAETKQRIVAKEQVMLKKK